MPDQMNCNTSVDTAYTLPDVPFTPCVDLSISWSFSAIESGDNYTLILVDAQQGLAAAKVWDKADFPVLDAGSTVYQQYMGAPRFVVQSLTPQEIEEYADGDTLKTHLSHMIDQTVRDMPNFTRCPNPDCNSGQVHEGGESHPFVTCAACNTQYCFRHGVPTQPQQQSPPSQHDNMSCDEYDRYLADPLRFRSEHQRQQERAAVERRELEAVARARARMDRILEQRRAAAAAAAEDSRRSKEAEDAARGERERRTREDAENAERDERERKERKEREEREERARLEERRYEEERARAEADRLARAAEIMRRKAEDEQSEWLIGISTKGCPRCAKRIEKNEGW
ncbi:hypothetical protein INS49_000814 [Diaporthe citri]|uniref:uncharacterized protein n=1 Tax=Diaporthe citri TaxID=83186 RepID=UPI001C7E8C1E|nr:uncharacterized protein INS49_000814 [Diaporthe citri]KAG6366636.1 hypothetical protein INS49_000814 [Diaporthe citri]